MAAQLPASPPYVICRTCANWLGRHAKSERRNVARTCGAGIVLRDDLMECERYVPACRVPLSRQSRPGA
jgi:hypothetical protein